MVNYLCQDNCHSRSQGHLNLISSLRSLRKVKMFTSHHPSLRSHMTISKLGHLVGRLQFRRYLNTSRLYSMSCYPSHSKVISLSLILPPSEEVQKISFESKKALMKYLEDGALCTVDAAGEPMIIDPDKYQDLSPLDTYTIATPYD
jgi:hypothetical protein